jgi:glycerol kinase
MRETTALGAAIAAGLAVGIWRSPAELRDTSHDGASIFEPKITKKESARLFRRWEKAVLMCRGWIDDCDKNSA